MQMGSPFPEMKTRPPYSGRAGQKELLAAIGKVQAHSTAAADAAGPIGRSPAACPRRINPDPPPGAADGATGRWRPPAPHPPRAISYALMSRLHRDEAPGRCWWVVRAARARLPNRRRSRTFDLNLHGLKFTATISRFSDGRLAEIFLQNHKPGSQADCNARDSAVAASLALQFGCPLQVLQRAVLRDAQGRPSSPLGAALDAIAKHEL